jgi:hypothetical protein
MIMNQLFKKNFFLFILLILVFVLPIIFFGIIDSEEYELGYFSAKILWSELKNFFVFYYDFYGPGTKLPLGHGIFFHFLNIIIDYPRFYYFLFLTLHLAIQVFYFLKVLKKFSIHKYHPLVILLLVFSLPNLHYTYSDDWLSHFFGFSFFPLIFFYFIKFLERNNFYYALKFSLFSFLWIINSHVGHTIIFIPVLIYYFFFKQRTSKKFFYLTFLTLFFSILLLSEHLYFLYREKNFFLDTYKSFTRPYELIDYIKPFLFQLPSTGSNNRAIGNPILIFVSFYFVLLKFSTIFKKLINNKKKLDLKKIIFFFLSFDVQLLILFLFYVFLSLTKVLVLTKVVSGPLHSKDVIFYLTLIIFIKYSQNLKKKTQIILIFLSIFYSVVNFSFNFYHLQGNENNNFISNKIKNSELQVGLRDLDLKKNDYSRVYISQGFQDLAQIIPNDGIFSLTDIIKYNLSPFQGYFKNVSFGGFGDQKRTMHGIIKSHYEFINNELFLNIYAIKYLLILKEEVHQLNNKKWIQLKKIKLSNDKILLIYKRNNNNLYIDNVQKLKIEYQNCQQQKNLSVINCILESKKRFKYSDHLLIRKENGLFEINTNKSKNIVLPFIYDENWRSNQSKNNKNFDEINKFLLIFNPKDNNDYKIYYFDTVRFILKIISFSIFVLIISYLWTAKTIKKKNLFRKKIKF